MPLKDRKPAPRFASLIDGGPDEAGYAALRRRELIGRPLRASAFLEAVGRQLRHRDPGQAWARLKGVGRYIERGMRREVGIIKSPKPSLAAAVDMARNSIHLFGDCANDCGA